MMNLESFNFNRHHVLQQLSLTDLSPMQVRLLISFAGSGDPIQSCIEAGYKVTTPSQANRKIIKLLKNDSFKKAFNVLHEELTGELIADAFECKAQLTSFVRDERLEPKLRVTCIKLLLQTAGEFVERILLEQHSTHTEKRVAQVIFQNLPAPSGPMAALNLPAPTASDSPDDNHQPDQPIDIVDPADSFIDITPSVPSVDDLI